jgi:chromosome segregation ATPase
MLRRLLERWRAARQPATSVDPLQTFEGLINELERQGTTFRQGAATLMSMRTELRESLGVAQAQMEEVQARWEEACARPDGASAAKVLAHDLEVLEQRAAAYTQQLARADADAELLLEGARAVQAELDRLHAERDFAARTLTMDQTMSRTLRARVERMDASPALEAARDEVARAHALADIYREGG